MSTDGMSSGIGEFRAGGTDVEARRRRGLVAQPVVDLRDRMTASNLERLDDGSVRISAMTRLTALRALAECHPGLAATAGSLANPHIRAVATLGGSLLQRSRCPYFRTSGIDCHKTGVPTCPARGGDHRFGVISDTSPCVAPHPSSMAMALLAHDASVSVEGRGEITVADLLGDGSDPTREHTLAPDEVMTGVTIPPPFPGEKAAYGAIAGRALAEWPMVEAIVRLDMDGGSVSSARIAVGGVATVPRRLPNAEALMVDRADVSSAVAAAASEAAAAFRPLQQTAYKVDLLRVLVGDLLERAIEGTAASEWAIHERPIR